MRSRRRHLDQAWCRAIKRGQTRARERGVHIGRPREEPSFDMAEAVRLREEGVSLTEIAEILGVKMWVVRYRLQQEEPK